MAKPCMKQINPRFHLRQVSITDQYTITMQLGCGGFSKAVLTTCTQTNIPIVLKLINKVTTSWRDFHREFNLSYFLSVHPCIVSTFDVAFQTADSYVFAQEFAPFGDLHRVIKRCGYLTETETKTVIRQVVGALEYLHQEKVVHRDVKPENILVFTDDLSIVKLADFGLSNYRGSLIRKMDGYAPYSPPEIVGALRYDIIHVTKAEDAWAVGILIHICLTGTLPWVSATLSDCHYDPFLKWQKSKRAVATIPVGWQDFTARLMKLFHKLLKHRPKTRAHVRDVLRYLDDRWVLGMAADCQIIGESSSSSSNNNTDSTSIDNLSR